MLVATLLGAANPVASAPADQPAEAPNQTTSVRMDVRAGFDGAGRAGGWVPLEVDLANEGSELRGEIQVVVQQGGGRSTFTPVPTTFTLPVVLPRLSNKRFMLDVNLPSASNRVTARLVRAPSGETVAEQDVAMTRVPLGDYFCGILARDPSAYDFLAALDLPPPIRRVRTAPLEPATVPERAQLLGSFDCIVVDNATTAQLRQEQLDALRVWTGTGGLLILVGGATAQSTLGPLPPALLPVELTGLANVDSLSGLGDLLETPLDAPGPWLVSQARPRPDQGAQVAVAQNGIPLIVAAKRGEGTVIYLAFEPTSRDLRAWVGNAPLWRYLVTHAAVDNGIGSALVRPYLRWGRVPRLALADFSTQPRPTFEWLWVLMGGYATVLGGGLFLFGRRGQVGRGLLTVALSAAGAGTLAFTFAQQRAEPDVAVTRLSVVRPIETGESGAAYTRTYLAVLAKREGTFSFVLPDDALARGMYYPFPRPSDESDATWLFRVTAGASPTLDGLALKQGQLATALADGQLSQAPGVRTDLRVIDGGITGTLTNRTGGRLSDAAIYLDGQFTPLGTLEQDQQRQVDLLLPRQAAAGSLAATAIAERLTPPGASGRPGATARRDLIESLFSARYLFSRMELRGPTLIGWLEQAPGTLQAPGARLSTADVSLLVQPLQPQLPRGFDGEVPATVMNRRDLGIGSGTPTDREYYSLSPGEAVTLQFTLPAAEGRFQFRELRLNVDGQLAGRMRGPSLPFTVSLYNWRAAEWQSWEVQPGSSIVPNGERYVSAAGDVRLRYLLDASLASTVREARLTRLDVTPIGAVL